MAGGKGKSSGGKSSGGKTSATEGPKKQQSHSARAGLQVRKNRAVCILHHAVIAVVDCLDPFARDPTRSPFTDPARLATTRSIPSDALLELPRAYTTLSVHCQQKQIRNTIEAIKHFIGTHATCAHCALHAPMTRLSLARSDFSGTSPLDLASHLASTWLCAGSRGGHRTRLPA